MQEQTQPYFTQSDGVNATEITRPFNSPRWVIARPKTSKKPRQTAPAPVKPQPLIIENPALLHSRLTVDSATRQWEAYVGPSGAQKFLNHFIGQLSRGVCRRGEATAIRYALNAASQKALARFAGARISSITINGEPVGAQISRLEMSSIRLLRPIPSAQVSGNLRGVRA